MILGQVPLVEAPMHFTVMLVGWPEPQFSLAVTGGIVSPAQTVRVDGELKVRTQLQRGVTGT